MIAWRFSASSCCAAMSSAARALRRLPYRVPPSQMGIWRTPWTLHVGFGAPLLTSDVAARALLAVIVGRNVYQTFRRLRFATSSLVRAAATSDRSSTVATIRQDAA